MDKTSMQRDRRRSAALGDAPHCLDEHVDLVEGVVERERRTHRGLQTEASQNRLRAVVPSPHGNAVGVECLAHLQRLVAGQHEGQHAGLFFGRADQSHPGNVGQQGSGVLEQCMLVGRDPLDAVLLDVTQRLTERNGVGDVAGAGLELVGQPLLQRAFQGEVGDHVAATLPGRRFLEGFLGAVEHADSGGSEDLVSGVHEEVRAE